MLTDLRGNVGIAEDTLHDVRLHASERDADQLRSAVDLASMTDGKYSVTQESNDTQNRASFACGCKNPSGKLEAHIKFPSLQGVDFPPTDDPLCQKPGVHLPVALSKDHCNCKGQANMLSNGAYNYNEVTAEMQKAIDQKMKSIQAELQKNLDTALEGLQEEYGLQLSKVQIPALRASVSGYRYLSAAGQATPKWTCCCMSGTKGKCKKGAWRLPGMHLHEAAIEECEYESPEEIQAKEDAARRAEEDKIAKANLAAAQAAA